MYEVTFWYNGTEKTMPDTFDTFADACEWARDGLRSNFRGHYYYDEAQIYNAETDEMVGMIA